MASLEMLHELWYALVDDLTRSIKDRKKAASAELLSVARKTLRDNRQGCPDDATRKRLEGLYRLYLRRLCEALAEPRPSAAMLAEARALLSWHGMGDVPGTHAGQVAKQLLDHDVPFKVTRH